MKPKFFQVFDYVLLFCVISLVTIGILFIYSSGINSEGVNVSNEYVKQLVWAGVGLLLMIVIALLDFRRLDRYVPYLYGFLVLILIYTRIFGWKVNGARSWIGFGGFGIQPAEFCKVIFILFLAWYLDRSQREDERRRFAVAAGILFVPLALILSQPDLGTASVYIPVFLVMCFMAGIPLRYLLFFLIGGVLTMVLTVLPVWQEKIAAHPFVVVRVLTNGRLWLICVLAAALVAVISMVAYSFFRQRYYYWIAYAFSILCGALFLSHFGIRALKDYQIMRLIVFLDPDIDPLNTGWHIIQSKIAIGSGGFFGRGFLGGTQSHYRFLPEQSTDFIFSILSEEWGFRGGVAVFTLYLTIMLRTIHIMRKTPSTYGLLIASGILGMFFFHFVVNTGMVMGIMPITGIPLLFLSYGGSSLWTAMVCIGLLMSINSRRYGFS
ncbi:MAG: rod shape-determining protein RodA [Treponemataceae bacterium]|nr:rod shape-determining protein RodA [Treponemataceae bacterium]